MVKKVEISDDQYDWLMARGRFKSTPSRVLKRVMEKVDELEADQVKYKAIASGRTNDEAEKTKGEKVVNKMHDVWRAWLRDEEWERADKKILDRMRKELEMFWERLKEELLEVRG